MSTITINAKRNEIVITKAFEKKASKFNSDEYKELQAVRSDYPNFRIVTRSTSKSNKNTFKGLSFDYMEKYIKAHDDDEQTIYREFLDMRALSDEAVAAMAESCSYGEIKAWFLMKYPEIAAFHERRANILAA